MFTGRGDTSPSEGFGFGVAHRFFTDQIQYPKKLVTDLEARLSAGGNGFAAGPLEECFEGLAQPERSGVGLLHQAHFANQFLGLAQQVGQAALPGVSSCFEPFSY